MGTPTPPDPFIDTSPSTPPIWTINTTSLAWKYILAGNGVPGLSLVSGIGDPSTGGTTAASSLAVSSGGFWDLNFSNSANGPIFGDNNPVVTYPDNPSVQGGVLGMVKPTTGPLNAPQITLDKVVAEFGITAANTPTLLTSFLGDMDSASLALKLNTSPSTRNALWAVPGAVYQVVISLTFDIQTAGSVAQIQSFVNKEFGLNLTLATLTPQVILTSFTSYTPTTDLATMTFTTTYNMLVHFQVVGFEFSALFTPTDVSLIVNETGTLSSGTSVFQTLETAGLTSSSASGSSKSLSSSALPDNSKTNSAFDQLLSDIVLWNLTIGFDAITAQPASGSNPVNNGNVYWEVALLGVCNFESGANKQELLVGVTYDSRTSSFSGKLIFTPDLPPTTNAMPATNTMRQYNFQSWTSIPKALVTPNLGADLNIGTIVGLKNPPPQIPLTITEGSVTYQGQSGGGYSFAVAFELTNNPKQKTTGSPPPTAAPSDFDFSSLNLNVLLDNDGTTTSTSIQVLSTVALAPGPSTPSADPADDTTPGVHLDLEYVSGTPDSFWYLEARANDIHLSQLAMYFDSSVRTQAQTSVGSLIVRSLDILYTFGDDGNASSFLFTATLVLGELELDLYYQYVTPTIKSQSASSLAWAGGQPAQVSTLQPGTLWIFEAFLGSTSPGSTIQSIITSISPSGPTLPGFVGNIPVNPASGGNSPGKLRLEEVDNDLVLVIQLVLADLDFTYISIGNKTVFRISVDQIPLIDSIPLISKLPQPFDSLLYLYLSDSANVGFNGSDLSTVNKQLGALNIPLLATKSNNTATGDAPVLLAGHHFMVLQKGDVVLDHVFSDANAKSSDPTATAAPAAAPATSNAIVVRAATASTESSDAAAPTKGNLDVQLPFLSISAITLQFKQASLYIDIDATMMLGPISCDVEGFEVVLHLTHVTLNDLSKMLTNGFITFGIHGLGVSVDESPLEIAGVFIHNNNEYMGGVSIGFEEWQFVAVGAYELITDPAGNYKSVFVYAKLNGPLVSLAFATISGVRLGFGYNSIVRSPTMVELANFPFLSGDAEGGAGNDPLLILQSMIGGTGVSGGGQAWVSPKEDAYWGAVGLTLTAFGILSVTAVLMLAFYDSGVVISILADGIAQLPPDADADATLFYVEIYMIAELNTVEGYFSVQASLAPSSHVLVSSCRLMGGFALFNWFDPNAHTGDFVFSVGGYHPAYTPPAWYPVPARLGISFTLGSMINVTGTVYFAITPKCVMGGGGLHMGLDVGPVSAWLDISLDVFIQFKPFHYTADLSVSVGCAMSINVWFVHIRISISVGAALHIQGPDPFGGYANVDFYLFSFTIHFGNQSAGPPPLSLLAFYEMVKTPGPAPSPSSSATPADAATSQLKFVLTSGVYPSPSQPASSQFPDAGATTLWDTKAGTFGCTIGCEFALTAATLINDANTPPTTTSLLPPGGSTAPPTFHSKPMHADASSTITSTISITIWVLNPNGSKASIQSGFGGSMVMKSVPTAIWGAYDQNSDPAHTPTPAALTDPSGPTMSLCMGVSLTPPIPQLLQSNIQDFDATAAFMLSLGSYPLAALIPKQATLLASGVVDAAETPPQRWAKVARDWTSFGNTGTPVLGGKVTTGVQAPGLLQMAAQSLGWDKPPPSGNPNTPPAVATGGTGTGATGGTGTGGTGTGGTGGATTTAVPAIPSWMLNGAVPDLLVANLATQYPVLPRYSAARTAV